MAVVQISKIQIRRGQKNSSSGVPQLSSAEMAWAVDTQELFIGNGSVQEGAPYVGNTKVLTEHDNILELANSYTFASDDPAITLSQPRTLIGKIDEISVSVADYGANGDGSTDNVLAFRNALIDLFRNSDPNYKKVLVVPNGEYKFLSDLEIPSSSIIRGETQKGAVLNIDEANIRFITSSGDSLINFDSTNRPENITIENITIKRSTGQTVVTGSKNCKFKDIIFDGEYSLGGTITSLNTEQSAVFWANTIAGIKVDELTIEDCEFNHNSISLRCSQSIVTDTTIQIKGCKFFENHLSIYVTGVTGQGNYWNIQNCDFEEVALSAFESTNGIGTKLSSCNFKNCGNNIATASNPETSIVVFGESRDNTVLGCTTDRIQQASVTTSELTKAVSEVSNSDLTELVNRNYSEIYLSNSFRPVAVFAASNNFITVNYVLRLGVHIRYGKIEFTIGDGLQKISHTDNYQFSDSSLSSEGGVVMSNFQFTTELRDNDTDSGIDTIVLSYKNPVATGKTGNISFDVSYGV